MPIATEYFRNEYRRAEIGAACSGNFHFWFTSVTSLTLIGACLGQVADVQPLEWLFGTRYRGG